MSPEALEILKTIGTFTPATIFAMMWWLERTDRLKLQDRVYALGREVVTAMTETKASLATLGNVFDGKRGRS